MQNKNKSKVGIDFVSRPCENFNYLKIYIKLQNRQMNKLVQLPNRSLFIFAYNLQ